MTVQTSVNAKRFDYSAAFVLFNASSPFMPALSYTYKKLFVKRIYAFLDLRFKAVELSEIVVGYLVFHFYK